MYLGMNLGHGQLKLDDAIDLFGIRRINAHCAYDDALATAELLKTYMEHDRKGFGLYLKKKGFRWAQLLKPNVGEPLSARKLLEHRIAHTWTAQDQGRIPASLFCQLHQ